MTDFQSAYEKVKVLVEQFKANEAALLNDKYQESQVRTDYLDKFFIALGWDVRHKYQTNPREQEVSIEANSDSLSNRKVDYAFFLAPDYKQPVFLVEAKKPRHDLTNADYYFQTIRYGYNRSTSISILTDFQEFHIIDCRKKPERSAGIVKSSQIRKFDYTDYLDEQKFGEIYWLFSREAVEQGKLKEFWKSLPKPKGIAKYAKLAKGDQLAPPDDEFLADLDSYREKLAKALRKTNPALPAEELTASVQATLDRLVFIRFLEDKLIEPEPIIDRIAAAGDTKNKKKGVIPSEGASATDEESGTSSLPTQIPHGVYTEQRERVRNDRKQTADSAWQSFLSWSVKLDKKYNGIVFKKHYIDRAECVPPDDKAFFEICQELSHRESPYLLNYIPVEILGSIYERFLGKVIVPKGKGIAVEEKPEVRKAGGVYYTPKYIVDYIVSNTVGKILQGNSGTDFSPSPSPGRTEVRPTDSGVGEGGLKVRPTGLNPKQVAKLRFADIACGSGSFLIAIFDCVKNYLEEWYNAHPIDAERDGCTRTAANSWSLSLSQKRDILKNNIYGVDLDRQAVEVAQLSLFLKLLESESISSTENYQTELQLADKTILPDLTKNIVCGNSLVERDIEDLFPLSPEDELRIRPFNFEIAFKDIMSQGGFDAIVGNPPYVRIQAMKEWAPREVEYFKSKYVTASVGNYDVYTVFVQRALSLLSKNGVQGYIVPHKFMSSKYGAPLRNIISSGRNLRELVYFGDQQVFKGATTYTCIMILSRSPNDTFAFEKTSNLDSWSKNLSREINHAPSEQVTSSDWAFSAGIEYQLFQKLNSQKTKLGEISQMFVGLQTSADTVFLFKDVKKSEGLTTIVYSKELDEHVEIESEILKQVVRSGKIGRFFAEPTALVLFPYNNIKGKYTLIAEKDFKVSYPLAWSYLLRNKKLLSEREHGKFIASGWYQLYPKNLDTWEKHKIMMPYMVTCLSAYPDYDNLFFVNVTTGGFGIFINEEFGSYKYFTGILNSSALDWFFKKITTTFNSGYYAANKQYLVQLPIPTLDLTKPSEKQQHDKMVGLVEQMLAAKKRLGQIIYDSERETLESKCAYLDSEIDKLVYELYGLTAEEIKIVEGA